MALPDHNVLLMNGDTAVLTAADISCFKHAQQIRHAVNGHIAPKPQQVH